ncbi:MAG: hypothetical protein P8P24_06560, partial [Planktomarina sp.]|nr:hypothetical protein [Planktomarina sp.]
MSARASVIEAGGSAQCKDAACGVAWYGQMQDWVFALMAADGKTYQQIGFLNFLLMRTLFEAVDPLGGWPRNWRRGDLFAAMQDHLSRAWCGVGLSEFTLNHPMLR